MTELATLPAGATLVFSTKKANDLVHVQETIHEDQEGRASASSEPAMPSAWSNVVSTPGDDGALSVTGVAVQSSANASSEFSVSTSAMTILPTNHGWERMVQRQVSEKQLQAARKYGTRTLQLNSNNQ